MIHTMQLMTGDFWRFGLSHTSIKLDLIDYNTNEAIAKLHSSIHSRSACQSSADSQIAEGPSGYVDLRKKPALRSSN